MPCPSLVPAGLRKDEVEAPVKFALGALNKKKRPLVGGASLLGADDEDEDGGDGAAAGAGGPATGAPALSLYLPPRTADAPTVSASAAGASSDGRVRAWYRVSRTPLVTFRPPRVAVLCHASLYFFSTSRHARHSPLRCRHACGCCVHLRLGQACLQAVRPPRERERRTKSPWRLRRARGFLWD